MLAVTAVLALSAVLRSFTARRWSPFQGGLRFILWGQSVDSVAVLFYEGRHRLDRGLFVGSGVPQSLHVEEGLGREGLLSLEWFYHSVLLSLLPFAAFALFLD